MFSRHLCSCHSEEISTVFATGLDDYSRPFCKSTVDSNPHHDIVGVDFVAIPQASSHQHTEMQVQFQLSATGIPTVDLGRRIPGQSLQPKAVAGPA
jgi:hypothetical protein